MSTRPTVDELFEEHAAHDFHTRVNRANCRLAGTHLGRTLSWATRLALPSENFRVHLEQDAPEGMINNVVLAGGSIEQFTQPDLFPGGSPSMRAQAEAEERKHLREMARQNRLASGDR